MSEKEYTLDEVSQHDNDDDCWIVVKGIVYDLTDFVQDKSQHPNPFNEFYGKDATVRFPL